MGIDNMHLIFIGNGKKGIVQGPWRSCAATVDVDGIKVKVEGKSHVMAVERILQKKMMM